MSSLEPLAPPHDPATHRLAPQQVDFMRRMREGFTRMMMEYEFAVDEVVTKVSILRNEYLHLHDHNPIEHITSRVKTPESIMEKVVRRGLQPSIEQIRENITDIAGVRIVCSFIEDTYRILDIISKQSDIRVITVKDYIANPKANGYKSLHAIAEIPVYLSDGPVLVPVEIQIRTIAMDFWASLEHRIYYKYDGEVPDHLAQSLSEAAETATQLDERMEQLHAEVHGAPAEPETEAEVTATRTVNETVLHRLWSLTQRRNDGDGDPAQRAPGRP